MTPQREEWNVALWLARKTEDEASEYVTQQIERLEKSGDEAGVAFWRRVCRRYDQLIDYSSLQ